jgi:copper chaperone
MAASAAAPAAAAPAAEASLTTLFRVGMTCEGCSGAVNRIQRKQAGVGEVAADVAAKTVRVTHSAAAEPAAMLAALKAWGDKAGKQVELVSTTAGAQAAA